MIKLTCGCLWHTSGITSAMMSMPFLYTRRLRATMVMGLWVSRGQGLPGLGSNSLESTAACAHRRAAAAASAFATTTGTGFKGKRSDSCRLVQSHRLTLYAVSHTFAHHARLNITHTHPTAQVCATHRLGSQTQQRGAGWPSTLCSPCWCG